jgi:hypothetical protein
MTLRQIVRYLLVALICGTFEPAGRASEVTQERQEKAENTTHSQGTREEAEHKESN